MPRSTATRYVSSVNNIFGPTRMNQAGLQRKQEVCGQCHFRGSSTNLTYGFPWKESVDSGYMVGTPLINYIDPNWISRTNQTGGPVTWPDTVTKRSYRQQWNEMQVSGHKHNQFLKCWDCHNQHSETGFPHQLRRDVTNNDMCLQCHINFGTPGNPNIQAITSHTKHIYDPTNQNQTGGASRCTKCHVTKTGSMWNTSVYDVSSHTFRVVRPIKTLQSGVTESHSR
jgi:predicted CXXCH cytochrome family protein